MTTADPIQAIADPRRRAILECLWEGEHSVGEVVERFGLTQPAISQHLKVLRDAGLVTVRREGQRRYYAAAPEGMAELRAFLERYWAAELRRAKREIEAGRVKRPGRGGGR
ncbi:MAG: metalloregulator ArsR/SmtB family transcription factor [Dehalococcoidia bacterium]|nr:metalloregulator ArsR/SmtB family transcription factor [Dehalococcoidia bacterium]